MKLKDTGLLPTIEEGSSYDCWAYGKEIGEIEIELGEEKLAELLHDCFGDGSATWGKMNNWQRMRYRNKAQAINQAISELLKEQK